MRALTLWQPWASMIAIGAKRIETRGWPCPAGMVGERIAIHAAATREHLIVAGCDPFRPRLLAAASSGTLVLDEAGDLPRGAVLCTVRVVACEEMTAGYDRALDRDEREFGWYEAGRFAWHLADVERLPVPAPVRGGQRVWHLPRGLLNGVSEEPRPEQLSLNADGA